MKTVFIAGPYRGVNAWAVEKNVQYAEAYIYPIAELGAAPLCPHTMTRNFDGTFTDEFWLEVTMELMTRCDAIFMVPGWQRSEGARAELAEAEALGLPWFDDMMELSIWLR